MASRAVSGFYVSLDAPSAVSVALVLTHAVLPKDLWLADRQLDLAGIPDRLHLDNAPEFDSLALVRGAQEYGISLQYRPPGQPHFGGHIERLIGTVMGAVHLLPGTTFSNPTAKGSYPSQKAARLTLPELERWLALQIGGIYHHSMHSVLHKPPLQAWSEGLGRRLGRPRQPAHAESFFLDFLPGKRRFIRRDGIRLFNLRYWANVLSPVAGRTAKPAMIKYDPRNLSRVFWQDEQGHYWPIPYLDLKLPPISLGEHRQAVRELHAKGRRTINQKMIFDAVFAQREILTTAHKRTVSQRKEQARQRQAQRPAQDGRLQPTGAAEEELSPGLPPEPVDYSKLAPFEVEHWPDE